MWSSGCRAAAAAAWAAPARAFGGVLCGRASGSPRRQRCAAAGRGGGALRRGGVCGGPAEAGADGGDTGVGGGGARRSAQCGGEVLERGPAEGGRGGFGGGEWRGADRMNDSVPGAVAGSWLAGVRG